MSLTWYIKLVIITLQIQTNVRISIFQQAKKNYKKGGDLGVRHQKMSSK